MVPHGMARCGKRFTQVSCPPRYEFRAFGASINALLGYLQLGVEDVLYAALYMLDTEADLVAVHGRMLDVVVEFKTVWVQVVFEPMFANLPNLSGADYIRQLRAITELNIFNSIEKNIMSAIGKESADYDKLLAGAKKAVRHGYKVYILPNPKGVRSADYIFVRKAVYKMYDLKTISGIGSIGSRLEDSIGQTNRVFLNLTTTYPTNRMATEIKQYFEANNEALEVLIAVGKKMVSVERYMVSERNFYKEFRKRIEQ
jgi:hypothetical protein